MRFDINLASQPYQDVQRFLVRWGVALFAVALVTAGLVYATTNAVMAWRVTERQQRHLRQQIADRDRQKAEVEAFLNRPENRDTVDRSRFLNLLLARKAFSWTEIFSDLEKVMPPKLKVVNIQPQINDDNQLELHLIVTGGAREGAIELVRRLETSPHFDRPEVRSETLRMAGPQNQPEEQFDITAIYVPRFARAGRPADKEVGAAPTQTAAEGSNAGH